MEQPESCKGCSQAHVCERVYEQLGKAEGPSITLAVLVAFLLPLCLFVAVLGACNVLLASRVASPYQAPLSLAVALCVTTASMLVARAAARRLHKGKQHPELS